MIKRILVLALSLSILTSAVTPKKAEAGILFIVAGAYERDYNVRRVYGAIGLTMFIVGIAFLSPGLVVLSDEGEKTLADKLPEYENLKFLKGQTTVLNELSNAFAEKVNGLLEVKAEGKQNVTLDRARAEAILEKAIGTSAQIEGAIQFVTQ